MKVHKHRKFTGSCELKYVDHDGKFKPTLINCAKPARFYPRHVELPGNFFGLYICDECFERKYGKS